MNIAHWMCKEKGAPKAEGSPGTKAEKSDTSKCLWWAASSLRGWSIGFMEEDSRRVQLGR